MCNERVLGMIDGSTEDEAIEIVLDREQSGKHRLQLRSRRWGSGIGWYTVRSLEMDASQLDCLIHALQKGKAPLAPPNRPAMPRNVVVPFTRYGT